jgi:Domain of unknown function (DUF4780)
MEALNLLSPSEQGDLRGPSGDEGETTRKRLSGAARKRRARRREVTTTANQGSQERHTQAAMSMAGVPVAQTHQGSLKRHTQAVTPKGTTSADTPSSSGMRRPVKKAKLEGHRAVVAEKPGNAPRDFKEAAQLALQVAILSEDRTPVTCEQSSEIRTQIVDAMDSIPEDQPLPRFENSGVISEGYMLVTCTDQASMDWLLSRQIAPIGGSAFQVVKASELRGVRFFVFIAGGSKRSSEDVFRRLARQNPGLLTSRWKVLSTTDKDDGQLWSISVDKDSVEVMRKLQFRPHFELCRLFFRMADRFESGSEAKQGAS